MGRDASRTQRLGDFELEEEIGRGGMGVVFRARAAKDGGRPVAVKVLSAFAGLDHEAVERFRREWHAAGRLQHGGIAPVLGVGEQDGLHWFAMELVDGPSLETVLDAVAGRDPRALVGSLFEESGFDQVFPRMGEADPPKGRREGAYARSCARIAADLASALAFAHRAGVVHRDVKPSNVLLRSTGRPVLVDFGLARDEASLGITQSGDAVGTPAYMAPEQAAGDRAADARTDVYGLGATLYEMLTLRPPFSGAHPADVMRRIVDEPVRPVRSLNARVPPELARIVERCLRKDPALRPPSMDALEQDLRSFGSGEAIAGRALPGLAAIARHRTGILLGAAILSTVALAVLGTTTAIRRGDERAAAQALDRARSLLRDGFRVARAEAAYGRAEAFAGRERVDAARRDQLLAVFDEHYARGRYRELLDYLDSGFPVSVHAEPWWLRLQHRAAGSGRIGIAVAPGADVRLRWYDPAAGRFGARMPWEPGKLVAAGTWLAEIRSPGAAEVVHRVEVQRDREALVVPLRVPAERLPPGFVLVPADEPGDGFAICRTELTAAELHACIAAVPQSALRAEMLGGAEGAADPPLDGSLPARGLSWRIARDVAVQSGGHVPSFREYLLAATAGVDEAEAGAERAFDWSVVVAAPDGALRQPRPAADDLGADSPHGLLHAIGNVAELIAPEPGGRPWSAGGSYRDDRPDALAATARHPLGPDDAPTDLGMRLARFVLPDGDPEAAAEADRLCAGGASLVETWDLARTGEVGWSVRAAAGAHGARLELPGFQVDRVQGPDPAAGAASGAAAPASSSVRLAEGACELRAVLRPLQALAVHGAHHVLLLPLRSAPGTRLRLRLPEQSRVDDVEPAPTLRFVAGGRVELLWDLAEPARATRARVVFRCDGSLATPWPAFADGERALRAALSDRRADGAGARGLVLRTVEDVTAVGTAVSVFARVDARGVLGGALVDWPVHAVLVPAGGRLELRWIGPPEAADQGTLTGGTYRHAAVGLVLDVPEGLAARRGTEGPWELQIAVREPGTEGSPKTAFVELRGVRDDPHGPASTADSGAGAALERLLASGVPAGAGLECGRSRPGTLGPAGSPEGCTVIEAATPAAWAGSPARRERWHFVERARASVLVRCVATGPTRRDADLEFQRAERALYARVLAALRFVEPAPSPVPGRN